MADACDKFQNQQHLKDGELVEYATQLNLNMIQFLQELAEHIHQARVQADIESGQQYGVESTPTFFIGTRHQGADNIEARSNSPKLVFATQPGSECFCF